MSSKEKLLMMLIAAVAGLGGGLGAAWMCHPTLARAQEEPLRMGKRITAQSFVLEDPDGRTRAQLALTENGTAALNLADEQGRTRVTVATLADGSASLGLVDEKGRNRFVLGLEQSGEARLVFMNADGKVTWARP